VVLHEIGHGLGFLTLADGSNGTEFMGSPDVFERFMLDITTGKHWYQMSNAERLASATNDGKAGLGRACRHLQGAADAWVPPETGRQRAGAIAGPMLMGRASFGAALSTPA